MQASDRSCRNGESPDGDPCFIRAAAQGESDRDQNTVATSPCNYQMDGPMAHWACCPLDTGHWAPGDVGSCGIIPVMRWVVVPAACLQPACSVPAACRQRGEANMRNEA